MRVRFPDGSIRELQAAELRRLGAGALQDLRVEIEIRDPFEPGKTITSWARGSLLAPQRVDVTSRAAATFTD